MISGKEKILQCCRQALERRTALREKHAVCRLFDGTGDGVPQLFIDRYGALALAHLLPAPSDSVATFSEALRGALRESREKLEREWGVGSFYLRIHPHDPREHRSQEAELVWGEPQSEVIVTEGPCRFIVRPQRSVNAGLYADTRGIREYLAAHSLGKRVLNLFCFSGSLGIAAAVGGAAEIAQIDSSPDALEWAKANWQLNQGERVCVMRHICDDCRHFLDREGARVAAGGKRTAIAVIDPPSFGRGRKRTFSLKRDVGEIVEKVMRILEPEGEIILTSNTRELTPARLESAARSSTLAASWPIVRVEALLPPAEDFFSTGHDSIAMRGVRIIGAGAPRFACR